MRPANIASLIFLAGLVAQAYGVFALYGAAAACAVVGTELGIIGVVGALRAR